MQSIHLRVLLGSGLFVALMFLAACSQPQSPSSEVAKSAEAVQPNQTQPTNNAPPPTESVNDNKPPEKTPDPKPAEKLRATVVLGYPGPHSTALAKGVAKAADQLGIDLQIFCVAADQSESAAQTQCQIIESLLDQSIDIWIIDPIESAQLSGLLDRIPTEACVALVFGKLSAREMLPNQILVRIDDYAMGRECGKLLKASLPNGGKLLVVNGTFGDSSLDRRQGFLDELTDKPRDAQRKTAEPTLTVGSYEILDTIAVDHPQAARFALETAALSNPEMDALVGLYPFFLSGFADYFQMYRPASIRFVCVADMDTDLTMLAEHPWAGFVVENYFNGGYQALNAACQRVTDGRPDSAETVLMVAPEIVTRDNFDQVQSAWYEIGATEVAITEVRPKKSVAGAMPPTSELIPWSLGNDLTWIAALHANGQSIAADDPRLLRVQSMVQFLEVEMKHLPAPAQDRVGDSARALHYLLDEFGGVVGERLAQRFDPRHATLFELAIKSGSLLIIYVPGDDLSTEIANVIADRATAAGLPAESYQAILDQISSGADHRAVVDAVLDFHDTIGVYLEQNGTPLPTDNMDSPSGNVESYSHFSALPQAVNAYELGFHWGMVADAVLHESQAIIDEFQPRAEANATALGITLPAHVPTDDRQQRFERVFGDLDNVFYAVSDRVGSMEANLFRFAAYLQIVRGLYDPDAGAANESFAESAVDEISRLCREAKLPRGVVDPILSELRSGVSEDDLMRTVFAVNGEILNQLRSHQADGND